MTASKADLWTTWLDNTLLEDIRDPSRPDPVPFLTAVDGGFATTNALDRYRYGKNDGEYLYFIYLADEPINIHVVNRRDTSVDESGVWWFKTLFRCEAV
ncbi:hypothetical protein [Salinigranum marinum]|uniref:hypothetical protein n=1 Tax=Salinigranum marinum TaxID=1515595 RepID=UPI002989F00A|nr:hypothetical protein [Salinigranum marinum]